MGEFPLEAIVNGYVSKFPNVELVLKATNLKRGRDDFKCDLEITTTCEKISYKKLHNKRYNLTSKTMHSQLVKDMKEKYAEKKTEHNVDWDAVLQEFADKVLEAERTGEPAEEIFSGGEPEPVDFLVAPLLERNEPNMLFGDGGSGKSYVADLLAIVALLPWTSNPYHFYTNGSPAKVLMLDYETSKNTVQGRLQRLAKGLDLPAVGMHYRRCWAPMVDDLEQIRATIADIGADLLIVDSIFGACAGDLNDSEIATRFYMGLRSLNITSLILHHTSKEQADRKTPFGSTYFWNATRSIWEVRKVQEAGENEIEVGLFHRKSNNSQLHVPIGLKLAFDNTEHTTRITPCDIIDSFESSLSAAQRILNHLTGNPDQTVKVMAEELDVKHDTVKKSIIRLLKQKRITKNGNTYSLSIN